MITKDNKYYKMMVKEVDTSETIPAVAVNEKGE